MQVFRDALNGDFMPPRSSMWASFDASPTGQGATDVDEAQPTTPRAHEFERGSAPLRSRAESSPSATRSPRWRFRAAAVVATLALGILALGMWAQKPHATHAAGVRVAKAVEPVISAEPMLSAAAARHTEPAQVFPERPGTAGPHATAAVGNSPRQACVERGATSMPACISRECRRPYFREHPQCLPLREVMARQQEQKAR